MNHRRFSLFLILIILLIISPVLVVHAQSVPVVHAVLFYSPSCGHCHYVITETLPALFEKYGEQLQIIGVDVSTQDGQILFLAALQKFGQERGGVPFLVIGRNFLVGSVDIPEKFPGLIEYYLARGGVDWPDIPGLREALNPPTITPEPTVDKGIATILPQPTTDGVIATIQPQPTVLPATLVPANTSQAFASSTATPGILLDGGQDPTWRNTFLRDPFGNTLSLIVLIGMVGALFWTAKLFYAQSRFLPKINYMLGIPALCLIGIFVAGYLAYVETSQTTAVCGPVGDCNTVQQSEYARLFGIFPIGVLGLAGYGLIAIAWFASRYVNGGLGDLAAISMFLLTASGTLLSLYLTFLEPFVIGATCVWCLTSAALMTMLMLLSVEPAKLAFSKGTYSLIGKIID